MKSIKNWIIVILTGALALSVVTGVVAQPRGGVNVELLVWQDTANPEQHYVTTRLAGGSWPPHGTVSVDLNRATPDGRWRYGKHTFELSVLATVLIRHRCVEPHPKPWVGGGLRAPLEPAGPS